MVEVVYLTRDGQPPEDGAWVLVARDASKSYSGTDPEFRGTGTIFHVPFRALDADRAKAIERAKDWAAKHNVSTVYVAAQ